MRHGRSLSKAHIWGAYESFKAIRTPQRRRILGFHTDDGKATFVFRPLIGLPPILTDPIPPGLKSRLATTGLAVVLAMVFYRTRFILERGLPSIFLFERGTSSYI